MLNAPSLEAIDQATATMFEKLLEERAGQRLGPGRQWRIVTALAPLAEQLEIASLAQLARAAKGSPKLAERVIDALVNGESSFFRDGAAFNLVSDLLAHVGGTCDGRPLRLWSAGCSTGQEPLSLAMLVAEAGLGAEIMATDVSPAAIVRARSGRFSQFEIQRGLSVHRMMRWFDGHGGDWVANDGLLARIRFRVANLLDPVPTGGFDLILCRNLLFYLTPEARRVAVTQLRGAVRPGGFLVLGAGETLLGDGEGFVASTRFRGAYEATGIPAKPALAARERAA